MAAGSTRIGRVHLDVWPDTSRFKQRVESKLRSMSEPEFKVDIIPDMDGFAERVRTEAMASVEKIRPKIQVDGELKKGYAAELRGKALATAERVKPKIEHRPSLKKGYVAELRALLKATNLEQVVPHRPVLAKGYLGDLRKLTRESADKVNTTVSVTPRLKGAFSTELRNLAGNATKKTHPVVRFAPGLRKGFRSELNALAKAAAADLNPKIEYRPKGKAHVVVPLKPLVTRDAVKRFSWDVTQGMGKVDLKVQPKVDKFRNSAYWYSWARNVRTDVQREFDHDPLKMGLQYDKGALNRVDHQLRSVTRSHKDLLGQIARMQGKTIVPIKDIDKVLKAQEAVRKTREDSERLEKSITRTTPRVDALNSGLGRTSTLLGKASERATRFSDRMGKASGRGARNNFLNLHGSGVRLLGLAVLAFPFVAMKRLTDGVQKMGAAFSDTFVKSGSKIKAVGAALAQGFSSATGSILSLVSTLLILAPLIGGAAGVASLISMLVASVFALTSSILYGLMGALLPLVPIVAALAVGFGVAAMGAYGLYKQITESKKGFTSLRRELSGAKKDFEKYSKTLAPVMADISETAIRAGRSLLRAFVPAVNRVMQDFNRVMNSSEMEPFFEKWRDDLPVIFESIGKGVTDGLSGLIAMLTPALDIAKDASEGFEDMMTRFREWATSDEGQKKITDWMEGARDTWQDLKDIFGGVGTALGEIFRIGHNEAGKPWLETLAEKAQELGDWAKSPEGQQSIKQWMADAKAFGESIGNLVARIGELWDELDTPGNRAAVNDIIDGIAKFVEWLRQAWDWLTRAADKITEFYDTFRNWRIVDMAIANLGNFVDLIKWLVKHLKDTWTWLNKVFDYLKTAGTRHGDKGVGAFDFKPMQLNPDEIFPSDWSPAPWFDKVRPDIERGVSEMTEPFNRIEEFFAESTARTGEVISGGLGGAMDSGAEAIARQGAGVASAAGIVAGMTKAQFNEVPAHLISKGREATGGLAGSLRSGSGAVAGAAASLRSVAVAGVAALPGNMRSTGRSGAAGMGQGLASGTSAVQVATAGLVAAVSAGASGAGTVLVGAGQAAMNGFISGINSRIGALKATLAGVTASLPSWKGPAETDRTILVKPGQMVMDGFIQGLESRYSNVQHSLGGLTQSLNDSIAENIGNHEMAAMVNLNSQWSSMTSTLRDLRKEAERTSEATLMMDSFEADNTLGQTRSVSAALAGAYSITPSTTAHTGDTYSVQVDASNNNSNAEEIADELLFGLRSARIGGPSMVGGF